MFAALALVAYLVQPGDTLSGIAASHGVSLAAVEGANSQLANPNLIYAGQAVRVPEGSSAVQASYTPHSYTASDGGDEGASAQQSAPSYRSPSSVTRPSTSTGTGTGTAPQASSSGSSGTSSSSLSNVPGVPQAFAACVAFRESTNLQNPAANGNAYGIIPASGYNVYGTSLAHQKQVFAQLYAQYGGKPWAADGCPGS